MGWVAASEDNWIPTQKSVGTDFYQSKDFSDDSTAGNRYVVVFLSTSTYVEELRGLTEAAALAYAKGENAPNTNTSVSFSDTKSGSPYAITVPAVSGKAVKLEATRDNEANGWKVVRTTTETSATATWGDGSYSDTLASETGSTKSASVRYYSQNVCAKMVPAAYLDGNVWSWKPYIVNLNTVETVTETTGLTESAAKTQAAAYGSGVTTAVGMADSYEKESHGAEARYGGSRGWTVTKTSRTSTPVVIAS